jgi:hypothetical protein
LKWFELVLLVSGVLWAFSNNWSVRNYYKSSATPMIPANTIAFVQTFSLLGILLFHFSPLHLLWLFPMSYVAGFFTMRSKILAFVPWVYGYLLAYTIPKNWC